MSIERSTALVLTGVLLASAFLAIPIQPSAAKSEMRGPDTWGSMFRHQIERCWRKPVRVGDEAASMKVEFVVKLTREGKLDGQPEVLPGSKSATSDYARAYQASALRAITDCQPFTLPAEYYDQWKHFHPVFMEWPAGKGQPAAGELDTRKLSICRG